MVKWKLLTHKKPIVHEVLHTNTCGVHLYVSGAVGVRSYVSGAVGVRNFDNTD